MKTTVRDTLGSSEAAERGWQVDIVNHRDLSRIGESLKLTPDPVVLGRDEGAFGGLRDDRVSRRHASLETRDGGPVLEDLGSSNGTDLNGRRIDKPRTLAHGDIVRVGSVVLLVQRVDDSRGRSRHQTLLGRSPAMVDVIEQIERVATRDTTVLLLGETGTGKEVAARALHDASGRRGPFVALNCGGVADQLVESELFGHEAGAFSGAGARHIGLAESADGGTLFLDEIGDASPSLQTSLLRFLQEGEVRRVGAVKPIAVDVRVVAATHRDLSRRSSFREDLNARLARIVLDLPPLRDRIEDVPLLARRFARSFSDGAEARGFDWRLMVAMLRYRWPANVRELQSFVERALIENEKTDGPLRLTERLERLLAVEPEEPASSPPAPTRRSRAIRPSDDELRALLDEHNGNVTAVAARLNAGRNTVYRWMKSAGLDLAKYRS